jgi:adenine-specific DNA-methyltransferase
MEKLKFESPDLAAANIDKIAELFPDVITESKGDDGKLKRAIKFDLLRTMLGDDVAGDEAYEFTWVGKREAIREAGRPIRKNLRPCVEESKNWDTTGNLYIEGDNLDVLKLLQESYLGKVKMIYIDPPYNTGNDFVYRDNFTQNREDYDEEAGVYDEDGDRLFKNTETNGRFHSDWCSMIYPRLVLARNMLRDDGVIFISIDDGEVAQLRKICDEILGEENFVAQIIWEKVYSPRMDAIGFSSSHDYILCYVNKNISSIKKEQFEQNKAQFNNYDEIIGKYYRRRSVRKEGSHSTRGERPNLFYPLTTPDGGVLFPIKPDGTEGCWRWSIDTYMKNVELGIVEWIQTEEGWQVYAKQFFDDEAMRPFVTLWKHEEVGHNHGAVEDLKLIFQGKVFDSPKPLELIKKMLKVATDDDSIILDFFSGSATTAHSVMQLNAEDGGKRKFIMVQLPEECAEDSEAAKVGYKNICEIGKERIRRAGEKIRAEKFPSLGGGNNHPGGSAATPPREGNNHPGVCDATPPREGNNRAEKFPSSGGVDAEGGRGGRGSSNYFSLPFNPDLKKRARELRKAGNLSEVLFWEQIKNKKFNGLDFDRQKIIGNYIVDFYCTNFNVVIEIDGGSHDDKEEYDAARDEYLKRLGLKVIHIPDADVKKNLDGVIEMLKNDEAFRDNHPVGCAATPPEEGNWLDVGFRVLKLRQQQYEGRVLHAAGIHAARPRRFR